MLADDTAAAFEATSPAAPETGVQLRAGDRIHQYEIIRTLGEGGMGTVLLARDLKLGRRVAIKVLRTAEASQTERVLAEARSTARCRHDNIVVIYEVGEYAGLPYLVLEHLEGAPLAALLAGGQRLPPARAIEIASAILRALQCAHDAGIVHRDLKPDNIFVTEAGGVKVLDFGIAKVVPPPGEERALELRPGEYDADAGVGTAQYMAPEQWAGGPVIDHLVDVWAWGLILYQMLCGRPPLAANELVTTVRLDWPMPSLADAAPPGTPPALIAIVDRCLAKRREQRWQRTADLLAALAPLSPARGALELGLDENPYAGLAAFEERDAGKFFGRNHEIAELAARLRERPLMGIIGSSGVGKSSFVRAGVIPALKRSGESWETLVVRPGRRPFEALAAVLEPLLPTTDDLAKELEVQRGLAARLRDEPGHLGQVLRLRAIRRARRVLLFVDQLEELYTLVADPAERAAFTASLTAAADDAASPLRVVISIRADFFDRVGEDRGFAGELAPGLFFLGRPGREGLRDALTRPAELAGFTFEEPAIIDDMLDRLAGASGALPLLQFTAARLWEARDQARRLITRASYAAIGGVTGALARRADETIDALPAADRALVRVALRHLVTSEGTRAVLERAELLGLLGGGPDAERVVERLVAARFLISSEGDEGAAVVEIVHEALIREWPRLVEWRREDAESSRLHEQLRAAARQWQDRGQPRGLLWRGDALAEYQRWQRRYAPHLIEIEARFGAASLAEAARGSRLRRIVVTAALVVAAVFVALLWRAGRAADHARAEAEVLLRDSYFEHGRLRVLEGDKLGALEPLRNAYRMGATGAATRLLLAEADGSTAARLLTITAHTEKLWSVAYSPDGKWLATASADGTARLWDATTGALRATVHHAGGAGVVAFSPDSRLLASSGADRVARVWDVIAGREITTLPLNDSPLHVAFSPDGSRLLAVHLAEVVSVWSISSSAQAGTLGGHGDLRGALFCATGGCIVTWDTSKVVVWDAATLAQRGSYHHAKGVIRSVAVSRSGALIAVGTESGELVLLRGDGGLIDRRSAHEEMLFTLAISPDESVVASGSHDRTARLWSPTGEPLGVLTGHRANITRVQFTAAGDRLVTTSADGTARLWSRSGMLLGELAGHTNIIMAADLSPDGSRLATASWDHTAMVWDLARAQKFQPIVAERDEELAKVAFDPSGAWLAVGRHDGSLALVEVESGVTVCRAAGEGAIEHLAWAGAGTLAVARRNAQAVELHNDRRCAPGPVLAHPEPVKKLGAEGDRIVTVAGGVVRVWRAGRLEASFTGYPGKIDQVGINGDDVYAFFLEPTTVVVDEIGGPARRRTFTAAKPVSDVRFDRARGQLLAASWDQAIYVWSTSTGALVRKLEGTGPMWKVRQSPDGAITIGVGGVSPTAWDAASGAPLGQLVGHSDLASEGDFLDDRIFATAAYNHTLLVSDVVTGRALFKLQDVDQLVVSADRRAIVLVGENGVRLWRPRFESQALAALARSPR